MPKKTIAKNVILPFEPYISLIARDIRNATRATICNKFGFGDPSMNYQRIHTASKVTRDDCAALRIAYFDRETQWLYSGTVSPIKEWCCLLANKMHQFFIIKEMEDKDVLYFCDENGVTDDDDSIIIVA